MKTIILILVIISVVRALLLPRHGSRAARLRVQMSDGKDETERGYSKSNDMRQIPPLQRVVYNEDDIKLKSTAFDVSVPANINIKLTESEVKMIKKKEAIEAAAREEADREGNSMEGMSDSDILKAEMKAMLERMRSGNE